LTSETQAQGYKGCVLFPDHIAVIDLSKNLPFFFTAQTNPIKMLRVLFSDQISQIDLILLGAKRQRAENFML